MKIIASLVIALMAKISIKAERKLRNFKSRFLYFGLIFVLVALRLFLEGYESGILKIVQFKHWDFVIITVLFQKLKLNSRGCQKSSVFRRTNELSVNSYRLKK